MRARIDESHAKHVPGVELPRFDLLRDGDRVYVQRNDGKWHVGEVTDVGYAYTIVPFITFLRQRDQERLDNYSIEKVRRVKQHATVRSLNLTVPCTHELATDVVEEDDLAIQRFAGNPFAEFAAKPGEARPFSWKAKLPSSFRKSVEVESPTIARQLDKDTNGKEESGEY